MERLQERQPPRKRRVELACVLCRKKKSRCDGKRPTCSPCLRQEAHCHYESLVPDRSALRRRSDDTNIRLARRVKELEAELGSIRSKERCNVKAEIIPSAHEPAENSVEDVPDEGAVDTLATDAFNEVPELKIGYFGPTSNHFLFRNLSTAFAHGSWLRGSTQAFGSIRNTQNKSYHPGIPDRNPGEQRGSTALQVQDIYDLPDGSRLTALINEFCDTVGIVLPYISRASLLDQVEKQHSRSMRALLNLICAHASSPQQNGDSESFYRRALALLDDRTLRGSNVEVIEALLLLSAFQQNNQRAVASWTYHALAVKAAYQLGLHSSSPFDEVGIEQMELRKRLWYAVINQDRCLGIALGRPFLIPQHHVRLETPATNLEAHPSANLDAPRVLYFNRLTSLYTIQSCITEALYDHNLTSPDSTCLQILVSKRLQLLSELSEWRRETSSFCEILGATDLENFGSSSLGANNLRVLLSIHFYKTVLLINAAVLIRLLANRAKNTTETTLPFEYTIPVIRDDFSAASILQRILHGAATYAFTVVLHLFGILLALQYPEYGTALCNASACDVRSTLDRALATLQTVERTSLMSRKARQCMEGFLQVYDSLCTSRDCHAQASSSMQDDLQAAGTATFDPVADDVPSEDLFSRFISQSADEFLFQCSNISFLDADFSYL